MCFRLSTLARTDAASWILSNAMMPRAKCKHFLMSQTVLKKLQGFFRLQKSARVCLRRKYVTRARRLRKSQTSSSESLAGRSRARVADAGPGRAKTAARKHARRASPLQHVQHKAGGGPAKFKSIGRSKLVDLARQLQCRNAICTDMQQALPSPHVHTSGIFTLSILFEQASCLASCSQHLVSTLHVEAFAATHHNIMQSDSPPSMLHYVFLPPGTYTLLLVTISANMRNLCSLHPTLAPHVIRPGNWQRPS